MFGVSVKTKVDEVALKKAAIPKPDLNFLKKPIWDMTNQEMFARCEIEQLAPQLVEFLFNFTDEKNVSDTAFANEALRLQREVVRIIENGALIEGELEDENGIAHSNHQ